MVQMNKSSVSKNKVISSLIWKFMERGGVQIVQFIISMVIARILSPNDYGIVAIITVFTSLATVFVQSGIATAIVQRKEITSLELSSVFYYSICVAALFYGVLYLAAPFIADFYNMPQITYSLRVSSLILFPGAFNSVQNGLVARMMAFKKQCVSSMVSAIISGLIGIVLAKLNIGVWALVIQQLSYQIIVCFTLLIFIRWRPTLEFSYSKTMGMLKYGIKLLGARLVDTIFHNIENLVIGKKYNSETLALYSKGKQFPLIIIDNLDGSIQNVMLPVFSRKQDDLKTLRSSVRQTISLSTYIVFPAMAGLAAVASPLIYIVLGEKWMSCVPFLQIYCLTSALFPFQTANLQAFNALGRSDVYFWITTIKRIIAIAILCIAVFCFKNVIAIAISTILFEIAGIIITIIANKRILKYGLFELLKDTVPNLLLSTMMFFVVLAIGLVPISAFLKLILQIITGAICYVGFSILTKNRNLTLIIKILKK